MIRKKVPHRVSNLKAFRALKESEKSGENKGISKLCVNPDTHNPDPLSLEDNLLKDICWKSNENGDFDRMTIDDFEELLALVESRIKFSNKKMRYALTPRVMLALTLRYIVSGQSYRSIESLTHIPHKTISKFVPKILSGINQSMQCQYMKTPCTQEEWLEIANDFETLWKFPHALGAVDGKHIQMRAPHNAKSEDLDTEIVYSITLFAVVDAHSRFIFVDVGGNGKVSDVDVMRNSSLYRALEYEDLNIPPPCALKHQLIETPFYFIGDQIFDLGQHLMKSYRKSLNQTIPQKIFNCRLRHALSVVGIAFGKLVSRFRIFSRPLTINAEDCIDLITACCILHNYLSEKRQTVEDNIVDVECNIILPDSITPLPTQIHNIDENAYRMRERIADYCAADGYLVVEDAEVDEQVMSQVE